MNDEKLMQPTNVSTNVPPVRSSPYEMLVRQSKKLGNVATSTLHGVQGILHRDAPSPTLNNQLFGEQSMTQMTDEERKKAKELEEAEKLKRIVKRSHQVLASARTVFPVTLFPDSIIVDRTKISIIKRDFFWTSNVISFQIEDVLNVGCAVGPLFGSLTIASRVMSTVDHFQINYLWRNEAIFLKQLIQGHIIAKNNKLETDKLTKKEMIETLCELGIDSDT